MTLPSWPAGVPYAPQLDTFQPASRALPPIVTEFEGGNERQRARPGDNVGMIGQDVVMDFAHFATFTAWWTGALNLGTARFTAPVWLGVDYFTKVCQFASDGKPKEVPFGTDAVRVSMKFRVYDV